MAEIKVIKLKQALKEMTYGEPFDVSFYTADKKRNTGGAIVELKSAKLTWDKTKQKPAQEKSKSINAPSHYFNATRNFILENGNIRKCHIWLLREFNNKRVVL